MAKRPESKSTREPNFTGTQTRNILTCPRCGGTHESVFIYPFKGEPVVTSCETFHYWLMCPLYEEPIFARPKKDGE